jgi:hypothetical protein
MTDRWIEKAPKKDEREKIGQQLWIKARNNLSRKNPLSDQPKMPPKERPTKKQRASEPEEPETREFIECKTPEFQMKIYYISPEKIPDEAWG